MVTVELTDEDAIRVKKSLELFLSDVRMEICDTDSGDFRAVLKEEKAALERVIAQLGDDVS